MSFIAGYLAGLEEGDSYRNEAKEIGANGEYSPAAGVRWDRVLVDVPQRSSGLMGIIDGLPVYASLALSDGYRIDFSIDESDLVPVQNMRSEWSYWYPQGGGEQTIYPSWRRTALTVFAKVYMNDVLLFARYGCTSGFEYNKQEAYSAREGWKAYISSRVSVSDISGMTAQLEMNGVRSPANIRLEYDYKKNWTYYVEGGVFWGNDVEEKHDRVYFSDISAIDGFQAIISDLDLGGKAKALAGLHMALIHTKGFDVKYDISNI